MSKGQVFTTDFIASITIFSFFLIFFGLAWNSSIVKFVNSGDSSKIQTSNTFSLLQTEGAPEDWNADNVSVPGLYDENYLSAEKFLELKSMTLSKKRSLLRSSEFLIKIEYLNGSQVTYNGEVLRFSSENIPDNKSIYVRRTIAVLDESRKRVELNYYSWQN
ncbi:MAG: hypothetical protein ABEK00_03770 [Candidatus Nanohaloarchaea archaeon]